MSSGEKRCDDSWHYSECGECAATRRTDRRLIPAPPQAADLEAVARERDDADAERNVCQAHMALVEEMLFAAGYHYEGETFPEFVKRAFTRAQHTAANEALERAAKESEYHATERHPMCAAEPACGNTIAAAIRALAAAKETT